MKIFLLLGRINKKRGVLTTKDVRLLTKKAMTFTGYRSKSSIGISLLKVKDCFQDNCCKDKTYFPYRQIFCDVFFALYQVCGSTKVLFNYRSHKKMKEWLQIQEKDYRNMRKTTET